MATWSQRVRQPAALKRAPQRRARTYPLGAFDDGVAGLLFLGVSGGRNSGNSGAF